MSTIKKVIQRIASEPAVTLGVVIAAVNASVDQTWQGYAVAVVVALLRFAVSPVVPKPE
jgi:urease accessory protein UreF